MGCVLQSRFIVRSCASVTALPRVGEIMYTATPRIIIFACNIICVVMRSCGDGECLPNYYIPVTVSSGYSSLSQTADYNRLLQTSQAHSVCNCIPVLPSKLPQIIPFLCFYKYHCVLVDIVNPRSNCTL